MVFFESFPSSTGIFVLWSYPILAEAQGSAQIASCSNSSNLTSQHLTAVLVPLLQ